MGDFTTAWAPMTFALVVLAFDTIFALPSPDAQVLPERGPLVAAHKCDQVSCRDGGVRLYPANHRYAWPSELDLMARLADLRLEHRGAVGPSPRSPRPAPVTCRSTAAASTATPDRRGRARLG